MTLNDFKLSGYIIWDRATNEIKEKPEANSGDTNGRTLRVLVKNSGSIVDLTGCSLNLGWKTKDEVHDGLDPFEPLDIKQGLFEITYTTGMLSNVGELTSALQLVGSFGIVESNDFIIKVNKSVIDANAIPSENSFATLAAALVLVQSLESNYSEKLDRKIYFSDTVAEMKQKNYAPGDVIHTKGYHQIDDGGGAEYHVTNVVLSDDGTFSHSLPGVMYAKLVIKNNKVNIRQLGAKADYGSGDTDNYAIIMKAFQSAVPKIDFVSGSYWVNDDGKRLTTNRWMEIEGGGATIVAKNGILFNAKVSQSKVLSRNLNVISGRSYAPGAMRLGIGIEVSYQESGAPKWGGCVDFEHMSVSGFHIGVKGDALYNTMMADIFSGYNDINYLLISTPIFSNMNSFSFLTAMYGKFGIVTEDFRNATFDNTIVENVDYPFVVDYDTKYVDFRNNWLEYVHNAPVTFGSINVETLELIFDGQTNDAVRFTDNRYSTVEFQEGKEHSELFFDASTPFSSRYKSINKPNFDFQELMDSGIQYTNLCSDDLFVTYQTGGVVSYPTENTPFGPRRVLKAIGVDSTKPFFIHCAYSGWQPGHVYLVKMRVKTNQVVKASLDVVSDPDAYLTKSLDTVVNTGAWTSVSKIFKLKSDFTGITFDEGGRIGVAFYEPTASLDVEAIEPAVYDLTEIFGAENEPDSRLNKDLEKYFTFIKQSRIARTGNVLDHSDKARVMITLENGWSGTASYRYLGNGLTEISGSAIGTGTVSAAGVKLFSIPSAYAPANTAVAPALVSNFSPYNLLMTAYVTSAGEVRIKSAPGSTVPENTPTAAVQFNFIVSSATR